MSGARVSLVGVTSTPEVGQVPVWNGETWVLQLANYASAGQTSFGLIAYAMALLQGNPGDVPLAAFDTDLLGQLIYWPDGGYGTLDALTISSSFDTTDEYTVSYRAQAATSLTDNSSSTSDPSVGWVPANPNFTPMTDADAAALVTRTPEIRSQHQLAWPGAPGGTPARNLYIPNMSELGAGLAAWEAGPQQASDTEFAYFPYVTGGLAQYLENPTTDEILQWASHKWGMPTDRLRAQAHLETRWNMDYLGDPTDVSGHDPDWYSEYVAYSQIPGGTTVYQSLGILQNRTAPDLSLHPGDEPLRYKSTAWNVDYCCSVIRFYLDNPGGKRSNWGDSSYVAGDYAIAAAGWFDPYPWGNAGQLSYQAGIEDRLAVKPWLVADFANIAELVQVVHQPTVTRSSSGTVTNRPVPQTEAFTPSQPPAAAPANLTLTTGNTIVGKLATAVAANDAIAELTLQAGVSSAFGAGLSLTLNTGSAHQTVTLSADVAQGATRLVIDSVTPSSAFGVGTVLEETVTVLWWQQVPDQDSRAPINVWHINEPDQGWLVEDFEETTGYTFGGLPLGEPVRFAVKAQNDWGYGPWSTPSAYATPVIGLPDQVSGVAGAQDLLTGDIDLAWSAPAIEPANAISGYVVVPVDDTNTLKTPIDTGSTATSFVVSASHLTEGHSYTFMVAAVNAVGQGPLSYQSAAIVSEQTTPPCPPQVAPANVKLYAGDAAAALFWSAIPTEYDGGEPINYYEMSEPDQGFGVQGSSSTPGYLLTGLGEAHQLRFTVAGVTSLGTGPASLPSNSVTTTAGLSGQPTNVVGTVEGTAGEIGLSWDAPNPAPSSAVTDYLVIPVIAGVEQTPVDTASNATTYTITGLTSGTAYTFRIQPINSIGAGLPSFDSNPYTPN